MENSMRKKMMKIIDEKASKGFTTYEEIIRALNDKTHASVKLKLSQEKGYDGLKQLVVELNEDGIIEKKKEGGVTSFKYKEGNEYFYARSNDEVKLGRLQGKDKLLFTTRGLEMILGDEVASTPLVDFESIPQKNIELVQTLFKYVEKKRVISFTYQQGYRTQKEITLHPHLLKEYNSRWFLCGLSDSDGKIIHCALDRIVYENQKSIKPKIDVAFRSAPTPQFYTDYFRDIVGVSKPENGVVETLHLKTINYKVHHLLRTKPIHLSQKMVKDFNEGEGEFSIEVIPNIELQMRILSYGPGLYVLGDGKFQQQLRKSIKMMMVYYCRDIH